MSKAILLAISILIIIFTFRSVKSNSPPVTTSNNSNLDLIVFWGQGCPHCEVVKKYLSDKQLDKRLSIALKEVYNNKNNQNELQQTIKKCPEIDPTQGIRVPLSYFPKENLCLLGDQPVIDYLKNKFATN